MPFAFSETAEGVTETLIGGGVRVIVAVPVFVLSATLVAVTVTVCCVVILAGAVYKPAALKLPVPAGLIDQLTLPFANPLTVALNCCVPPCERLTVPGETITTTGGGLSVTVALADFEPSATLVAVTVTLCVAVMTAGAV